MEYLINVVVASRSYWMMAAFIYAAYFFLKNSPPEAFTISKTDVRKYLPTTAVTVFVLGTLIGLTSPSNTYKLTTDYNKTQDLRRIEQLDESVASRPLVIQDISRQPLTVEDRAASAVDMRTRVEAVEETEETDQ